MDPIKELMYIQKKACWFDHTSLVLTVYGDRTHIVQLRCPLLKTAPGESVNPSSKNFGSKKKETDTYCHAHRREILSYLHIPKTMSMFYMYEATIVTKILIQVL